MATKWTSPTWRMPEESNQSKFENYSLVASTSGKINIATPATVGITSSFSFWFKRTNITHDSQPYGIGSNYGMYMLDANGVYIRYGGAAAAFVPGSTELQSALASTDWVHWVITRKETSASHQDIKIYANGNLVDSQNTNAAGVLNSEVNSIMHLLEADDDFMSQFVVFDYELSQAQISYLYNSGTPINPMAISGNAPIAYYPLGGGSTGSASTLPVPNDSVTSATVFDFDGGINNGININNDSSLEPLTSFTLSCWIKSETSQNSYAYPVYKQSSNGSHVAYGFYLQGSSTIATTVTVGLCWCLHTGDTTHTAI